MTDSTASPGQASRRATLGLLAAILLLLIWYLLADRLTPYSSQARVQAFVVPVAAEVSGQIKRVYVHDNQDVDAGSPLFEIDPEPYDIALAKASMGIDLGLSAAAYGLGAGLFFIGYALFEVPSNMLLQKVGARLWLTRIMFTWGLVATAMAFVQTETQFYVLRFLLGVAEAGFFPGVIYYFTRWLPGVERGKAIAIFLSGSAVASLISGPLSGLLLQINGLGMHGWQWMYFIEGMFSVCLCVFVWFWLDAKPHDAKWLTRAEQDALVSAIDDEQKAREAATPIRPSMGKLLKDRQIILFCLIYFFIQLTIYAATKKANEAMAHSYAHLWNLPTTMFRFFTVYGPWGRPDMALFKFTRGILEGTPIDIYNDGEMYRDFTYVSDLVRGIRLLIDAAPVRPETPEDIAPGDSLSPVAPYRVVNIGNGDKVRLMDFVEAIEAECGRAAVKNFMPMQQGDVPATWADASLLKSLTGYAPQTPFREGVARFVAWYRDYYRV